MSVHGKMSHRLKGLMRDAVGVNASVLKVVAKLRNEGRWRKASAFDQAWRSRIEFMASLINDERTVLDLGCGQMWLKEYIEPNKIYISSDMYKRDENTIVCDYNAGEFPDVSADVVVISGVVEYMDHPLELLMHARKISPRVLVSYVSVEEQDNLKDRTLLGWRNHLSKDQFIELAGSAGLKVKSVQKIENNIIFELRRPENHNKMMHG